MRKNISIIGIGKLGLCFGLVLADSDFDVLGCDINQETVEKVNNRTFTSLEPEVTDMMRASINLQATTSLFDTVEHARLIFVTVATFSEPDGSYNVSQVDSVVDQIESLGVQPKRKHLVICCNVNPGYTDTIAHRLENFNWDVSYNPETVAQGTIIQNQKRPDCIYVGSAEASLAIEISEIYEKICYNNPAFYEMKRLEAELAKVSLNCFLTCKISFANMVGDLCEKLGANSHSVLTSIGADSRVNNKFFKYGFGWGGPCFPRDTKAFIRLAKNNDMPYDLCEASNDINEKHLNFQIQQFLDSGKKEYFTESVTYKPGTTILEESQQLKFALSLAQAGVKVTVKESPEVIEALRRVYGDLLNYE